MLASQFCQQIKKNKRWETPSINLHPTQSAFEFGKVKPYNLIFTSQNKSIFMWPKIS